MIDRSAGANFHGCVLMRLPPRGTLAAVIASLILCVAGWPDARIGVAVNVGLALLLVFGARLNLAVLTR